MHQFVRRRKAPVPKHLAKAIAKAERELDQECIKQTNIIFPAGAIALHNRLHWNKEQIREFFKNQEKVYAECGSTTKKSMIQMCDEECDIDMMRETSNRDWREVIYLNPEYDVETLSPQQWIYMRQQQKKWVRAQLLACYMLTAKRFYKLTYIELEKLFKEITWVILDYYGDEQALSEACDSKVGLTLIDLQNIAKQGAAELEEKRNVQ